MNRIEEAKWQELWDMCKENCDKYNEKTNKVSFWKCRRLFIQWQYYISLMKRLYKEKYGKDFA